MCQNPEALKHHSSGPYLVPLTCPPVKDVHICAESSPCVYEWTRSAETSQAFDIIWLQLTPCRAHDTLQSISWKRPEDLAWIALLVSALYNPLIEQVISYQWLNAPLGVTWSTDGSFSCESLGLALWQGTLHEITGHVAWSHGLQPQKDAVKSESIWGAVVPLRYERNM